MSAWGPLRAEIITASLLDQSRFEAVTYRWSKSYPPRVWIDRGGQEPDDPGEFIVVSDAVYSMLRSLQYPRKLAHSG